MLASLRWVKSHNYITADENISVGKNATLKNEGGTHDDGGITFAAHDKLELNPGSMGFSEAGLGDYVRAETSQMQTLVTDGSADIIRAGANINAQDIAMTVKESISQGYTDGIVNIAYTPEHAYADEAKKLHESIG